MTIKSMRVPNGTYTFSLETAITVKDGKVTLIELTDDFYLCGTGRSDFVGLLRGKERCNWPDDWSRAWDEQERQD